MHRIRTRHARRIATWAGLLGFLALAAAPARAQDQPERHDPEEHLAKLQEELNLDEGQVEQIRAIFAERHAEIEGLHEEGGDRESKREAFRQLHEETHAQIQAVLNEQQRARLEELHAEYQKRHDHGPGNGCQDGHGAKQPENG